MVKVRFVGGRSGGGAGGVFGGGSVTAWTARSRRDVVASAWVTRWLGTECAHVKRICDTID